MVRGFCTKAQFWAGFENPVLGKRFGLGSVGMEGERKEEVHSLLMENEYTVFLFLIIEAKIVF